MIILNTNKRLLEHAEHRLTMEKGTLRRYERIYKVKGSRSGVTLKELGFQEGRVSALREAAEMISRHLEQAKDQSLSEALEKSLGQ